MVPHSIGLLPSRLNRCTRWLTVSVVELREVSTFSAWALTSMISLPPATVSVTGNSAIPPTVMATPAASALAKPGALTMGIAFTDPLARAETRRLTHWFNVKFFDEASQWLVREKITKRIEKLMSRSERHGSG